MIRGYDPEAQQVWQMAKVLAFEEERSLSPSDLWWGCLAVIPEQQRGEIGLSLSSEKEKQLEELQSRQVEQRVSVESAVTKLDRNLKEMCRSTGVPAATVWHVFLELLEHPGDDLNELWGTMELDPAALRQRVQEQIEGAKLPSRQVPLPDEARRVLNMFTQNLTDAAARGELTPAYERDKERASIVRTLLRKKKRNVALVGPAGVGKTKLVEDLALRLVQGEIEQLADCEIFALSPTALRAGASMQGEVESRFERLRNVLEDYGDRIILFIDEMHVIVGTALSSHTLDLANALKPLLTSGRIRTIGATTQQEFIQYIERDRALARRFQMVIVPEPNRTAMECILDAVRPSYEQHYNLSYPPETLRTILDLGDVYLPNRYYPDKALDLLDEAGAWVIMQSGEPTEEPHPVPPSAVKAVLSEILQIPLDDLTAEALPDLAARLGEQVVGQDSALQQIQNALIASSGRTVVSSRPRAGMVFVGPLGCGKTYTAQVLSDVLCHSRQVFLELDLDQVVRGYWHGGGADFLLGPRPPYVGWEHGGVLTNHVLTYPQSVILVRGIARSQADVQNLFAGILDRGEVEDGRGQRVTFRGVVLLFVFEDKSTSNRPIGFLHSTGIGASSDSLKLREELLQEGLLPALLRRIEHIVAFQPLSTDALREIARRRLETFCQELYQREGKAIDMDDNFLSYVISPKVRTASEAEQQVERHVILPLNALRSSQDWASWRTIRLVWEEGVALEPVVPRVLIVDDLPDFYQELGQSYPEYRWLYAAEAASAALIIERDRPHLVLIDTCFSAVDGEDVGGLAVLKDLKKRFPTQQMVPVTAQGMDFQTTREAFRVGAYDYLWKPPEESVLRQLVAALVVQEEQERRLAVQDQLLRTRWQRKVEDEKDGVRITYHTGGSTYPLNNSG